MKNTIYYVLKGTLAVLLLHLYSCGKDETSDLTYGIDPTTQQSLLCKSLRLLGNNKDGDMPVGTGVGQPISMSTPSVVEVSAGILLFLPYTVSDTSKVCNLYLQVEGADNYWETKLIVDPSSRRPYFKILIPKFVRDGEFDFAFSVADCNGNVSRRYSTKTIVSPLADCNTGISGTVGITVRAFDMGDIAGRVDFNYQMFQIPDRMDISYNGEWVESTGKLFNENVVIPDCSNRSDGFVSGRGTLSIQYDPKISRTVEVYISGCNSGTEWEVDPVCPTMPAWYAELPPCPCTYAEAQKLGKTKKPVGEWSDCGSANETFHYGATNEVRWKPSSDNAPGQQCTYGTSGKLITGGIAAGSPDFVSPSSTKYCSYLSDWIVRKLVDNFCDGDQHCEKDVKPWLAKGNNNTASIPCWQYLRDWPANKGQGCGINNSVSEIQHMRKLIGDMSCEEATLLIKSAKESPNLLIDRELRSYIIGESNIVLTNNQLISKLRNWKDLKSCFLYPKDELCLLIDKAIKNLQ
jgi:hypothetical protein